MSKNLKFIEYESFSVRREKGEAMVAKLGENSEFSQVDINDAKMLETSLRGLFHFPKELIIVNCQICLNFYMNLDNC